MREHILKITFPILVTITLFSLWAGFALLVINPLFHQDLPAYTIGRICIWELVALVVAILITRRLIQSWGNAKLTIVEGKRVLLLSAQFGIYFAIYFLIALFVAIWQFWLFSQNF